jgi:hypothetical protein
MGSGRSIGAGLDIDATDGVYVIVGHTGTLHVGTILGFGTGFGYHLVGRHAGR